MSKTKAEILDSYIDFYPGEGTAREAALVAMEEYGKQMWNAALEWAADNAVCAAVSKDQFEGVPKEKWYDLKFEVWKESILKGKI